MFGKQIHELDRSDLERLKAERTEEDQFLEFKGEIPADNRNSAPGWTQEKASGRMAAINS